MKRAKCFKKIISEIEQIPNQKEILKKNYA